MHQRNTTFLMLFIFKREMWQAIGIMVKQGRGHPKIRFLLIRPWDSLFRKTRLRSVTFRLKEPEFNIEKWARTSADTTASLSSIHCMCKGQIRHNTTPQMAAIASLLFPAVTALTRPLFTCISDVSSNCCRKRKKKKKWQIYGDYVGYDF